MLFFIFNQIFGIKILAIFEFKKRESYNKYTRGMNYKNFKPDSTTTPEPNIE